MTKFSWCAAGPEGARVDHEHCPGQIGGPEGLRCTCSCHEWEAE